jgi:hypothetical protein
MNDPKEMATHREIMNLVLKFFGDDYDRTTLWFRLPNPSLGDLSPNTLIRMGRIEKLAEFVRNAMDENAAAEAERGQT